MRFSCDPMISNGGCSSTRSSRRCSGAASGALTRPCTRSDSAWSRAAPALLRRRAKIEAGRKPAKPNSDERQYLQSSGGESVRSAMDYVAQIFVLMTGLLPKLVAGFAITLAIATAAMPLALVFGLLLLLPRLENSAVLEAPIAAFIEVMRNTPLLLQIYLVYFGLPLLGFYPSEFTCGVLGIAVQHGCFLTEIYRGAIESVSRRQWDAARAIGMGRLKAFRHVIL